MDNSTTGLTTTQTLIIVASIAGVLLLIGLAIYMYKRSKDKKMSPLFNPKTRKHIRYNPPSTSRKGKISRVTPTNVFFK